MERFDFDFSRPFSWPLALLGVTPWTAHVAVGDGELAVRFGPWSLATPLSNVEGASITGPYLPFKVLGPHVSLADRGVTFGTAWGRGVCIRFRRPVPAALPGGLLTHPAVTVTVSDPERLVAVLEGHPTVFAQDEDAPRPALQVVPADTDLAAALGTPDGWEVADEEPIPVATPPASRPSRPRAGAGTRTGTGTRTRAGSGTATRRRARTEPEHPTPADMPKRTPTEKVAGVTPPADEDLPGPDPAP